ncbi:hypothetical protein [Mucisphaera sp.]|uniref:hypothetical protein n=1 Tax=Mucisphaera sp. TaxID=2913024 RepID=UPI003D0CF29C
MYIAAANDFGTKQDSDGISIDLATNGLAAGFGATGVGNATVTDLVNVEIDGQTTATLTQAFTLTDPTDGLVLGFGGYGTGYGIDNIMIAPVFSGLLGDFDGDSDVDAADIDLLTGAIRDGSADLLYDVDGSGVVDDADLSEMVGGVLGTLPGDANLDSFVDLIDLSTLASSFNGASGWAGGNFNTDTVVDLIDLSLLASNFGAVASVPEPAVAGLLVVGCVGLLRRR